MGAKNKNLLKKLQAAFKVEAQERLEILSSNMIELENAPYGKKYDEIIESVFRQAHSLKGASRSANLPDIENISKALEILFSKLKRKEIKVSPEMIDSLHHIIDALIDFVAAFDSEDLGVHKDHATEIVKQIGALSSAERVSETKTIEKEPKPAKKALTAAAEEEKHKEESSLLKPPERIIKKPKIIRGDSAPAQSVRVSLNKLDSLMLQTEEMLQVKLLSNQHKNEIQDILETVELWKEEWSRVANETRALTQVLPSASKLLELVESNQNQSRLFEDSLLAFAKSAHQDHRLISELVDRLLEDMKDVLMLPFSTFLEMAPKMVRDLACDQKKNVKVTMKGGEVEIDRKILEEMKDPLIHLLRNCVDHGIEKPEVRQKNKKSKTGTVEIMIGQANGDKVEIAISDDGAGVDIEKVKKVAIKKGFLSKKEAAELPEQKTLELIFKSELTTSPIVTDLSGRGLGLAIVREKVERLGGNASIENRPGQGTTFRALLPISLAAFRGILVEAGEQQFIMPTTNVDRVVRVNPNDVKTVENRETILLNGQTIPLIRLNEILGIPHKKRTSESELITAMVLGTGEKRIAFSVNQVLNEEEILFKSLGTQLSRVRNINGATVLGNRKVVPVLNVMDLMKSAVHVRPVAAGVAIRAEETKTKKRSVLVAEDSITSRMLIKTILESAGYQVKTTADGLEALTELKEGEYDLLVSDIDMPRMNGFVLTEKIRANKQLVDLPVILVTALSSREDRERGIDAGANAYIIKSSFDQSNLLEVIKRHI